MHQWQSIRVGVQLLSLLILRFYKLSCISVYLFDCFSLLLNGKQDLCLLSSIGLRTFAWAFLSQDPIYERFLLEPDLWKKKMGQGRLTTLLIWIEVCRRKDGSWTRGREGSRRWVRRHMLAQNKFIQAHKECTWIHAPSLCTTGNLSTEKRLPSLSIAARA